MTRSLTIPALALVLLPCRALAQDLTVTTNLPQEGFVERQHVIELTLSRPLDPAVERLAVFIGPTDVTDLFRSETGSLQYDASAAPLPSGEGELVVHRVGADGVWSELARFPLRVVGRFGFGATSWDPKLDLGVAGNLSEGHDPDENAPERDHYQDVQGQLTFATEANRGALRIASESAVMATSYRPQALRFGERGEDAPRLDLSNYVIRLERGPLSFALGHVGVGEQRHLLNSFNSRGALLGYKPHPRVDFSLGAMNGTSIVGWSNFVGLNEPDHRVVSAIAGFEGFARPGALRVELTWLGASALPQSGFNQEDVNDAEESDGVGLRILSNVVGGRVKLEGGYARSTYVNPFDPTLAQGDDLVPVEEETKNARYLQASVDILRNRKVFGTRTATASLGYRHERVDPLYQSLAAYVRPDALQDQYELRGALAGIQLQATHTRSEDNLDEIESILKTKTRRGTGSVTLPVATVFGVQAPRAVWLPQLRYGLDRTHQFGAGLPPNSGFSASHVPDQVSLVHSASADWRWSRISFGWRLNRSKQDNRQTGREAADLVNRSNMFSLGLTAHERLRLAFDLGLEKREARERDEIDRTRRWGVKADWSVFDRTTVSLSWAETHAEARNDATERDDTTLDAQWSSFIPYLDRFGGQYFIRFGRTSNASLVVATGVDAERSNWNADSGLNFSFF
ncbi:MAG: hypothetical protein ABR559_08715 [Gemmatimonadota bacterium]